MRKTFIVTTDHHKDINSGKYGPWTLRRFGRKDIKDKFAAWYGGEVIELTVGGDIWPQFIPEGEGELRVTISTVKKEVV